MEDNKTVLSGRDSVQVDQVGKARDIPSKGASTKKVDLNKLAKTLGRKKAINDITDTGIFPKRKQVGPLGSMFPVIDKK